MSATFLVTGFEPFAEHRANSSWEALALLRLRWPESIATLRLPVDHARAHVELRRALAVLNPRVVLCTGLARGDVYRIEHRARRPVELVDAALANPRRVVTDAALVAEDAAIVAGRWPWQELRRALRDAGVVAVDSDDAGQYVCESTYWSLVTYAGPVVPEFAAFLHVPPLSPEQPVERIASAIASVIEARRAALGA